MESILLRVKNIMVLNGCTDAFFVGSMRNKDLQGQDILSQVLFICVKQNVKEKNEIVK